MESFEFLKHILESLNIDWAVVLLYICAGLIAKVYLPENVRIPFTKLDITNAWRTLIIGSIIVAIYVFIEYKYPAEFNRETLKRLFVSYIFTTSFYELALKDTVVKLLVNLLNKIKPKDDPEINNENKPV